MPAVFQAQRPLATLAHVALATLILLAVVALNGRPSVFPDTAYYYSQGRYLAERTGMATQAEWAAAAADPTAISSSAHAPAASVAGARSAFYGVLVYATSRLGSIWWLAAAQAAASAWMIWVLVRAVGMSRRLQAFYAIVAVLALGSSLPFFAAFIMPDIFLALGLIGWVMVLLYWPRLRPEEGAAVVVLTAFGGALHTSHLLVLSGLLTLSIILCAFRSLRALLAPRLPAAALLVAACALLAVGASACMARFTGQAQGQPPFLTARVLADGPGRDYLRTVCPARPKAYALCRFQGLALTDADDILWSQSPRRGVFSMADPATRGRLQSEQGRFVLDVVLHAPAAVARAAAGNALRQLAMVYVEDPLRNPSDLIRNSFIASTAIPSLIPNVEPCRSSATACQPRAPFGVLRSIDLAVLLVSLAYIGWRLAQPDAREALRGPRGDRLHVMVMALALLGAAILINAIVCGVLSGPFPRYQARMSWLIPLGALLVHSLCGECSKGRSGQMSPAGGGDQPR